MVIYGHNNIAMVGYTTLEKYHWQSLVKKEEVELDTLPKWIKSITSLIPCRIHKLKFCVKGLAKSINQIKKKPASECLSFLCGKYGFVLADKIVFACKHYYYVIKELRTSNHTENPVLTMKKSRQITSQCRRQWILRLMRNIKWLTYFILDINTSQENIFI